VAACYFGPCAVGSAFTLDFPSVPIGTTISSLLTIAVPSRGDIRFDAVGGSNLNVKTANGDKALNFVNGDSVTITFLGNPFSDLSSDVGGLALSESS